MSSPDVPLTLAKFLGNTPRPSSPLSSLPSSPQNLPLPWTVPHLRETSSEILARLTSHESSRVPLNGPPSSPHLPSPSQIKPREERTWGDLDSDGMILTPRLTKKDRVARNYKLGAAKRVAAKAKAQKDDMEVDDEDAPPLPSLYSAMRLNIQDICAGRASEGLNNADSRQPTTPIPDDDALLFIVDDNNCPSAAEAAPSVNSVQVQEPVNNFRVEMHEVETHEETVSRVTDECLKLMEENGVIWGEFVMHICSRNTGRGNIRWHGLFRYPEMVVRILEFCTSSYNSKTGRATVVNWAVGRVCRLVYAEGNAVTKDGILRARDKPVDEAFVLDFDLHTIYGQLKGLCPTMTRVLHVFSTTKRQERTMTEPSAQKHKIRVLSSMLDLLGQRSQQNSWVKYLLALYFYATGTQRQPISVLASLGKTSSYGTVAGTKKSKITDVDADVNEDLDGLGGDRSSEAGSLSSDDETSEEELDVPRADSELVQAKETSTIEQLLGGNHVDDEREMEVEDNSGENVVDVEHHEAREKTPAIVASTLPPTDGDSSMGLLRRLSEACRNTTRHLAQSTMLSHVYDNINFMFKAAEPTVGRKDSQENGTCATVFPLYKASPDDMQTKDLIAKTQEAPPLSISDVQLTLEENAQYNDLLTHTLLRIIVTHGGEGFNRFKEDVANSLPVTDAQIPVHKTETRPLPAMNIDEASVAGNGDVIDAIGHELGYDKNPERLKKVEVWSGDQLSMAHFRTLGHNRLGHDALCHSHVNSAQHLGMFHGEVHVSAGCLETHWGTPGAGARDPGGLLFHNTLLDRKPITLTSLPPYRTCRDLIFVSLYARVLHCLELVSGKSLEEYAKSATFEELQGHAAVILDQYANGTIVDNMRDCSNDPGSDDTSEPVNTPDGITPEQESDADANGRDHVFENAILFLRDALIMREFVESIKTGDSGRVVLSLKKLAAFYRGSGRTKYAYETLVTIHNLTHVWPEPLRRIIMNNWLVNPTGHVNGFIPTDLLQEHMNFWIKKVYQAQGANASWEWLEMISPCITVLRALVTQVNGALGTHQGSKHATPDLSRDINLVMESLRTHKVYMKLTPEDRNNESVNPVTDTMTVGYQRLGQSIRDYNVLFERLRKRRALRPLITDSWNWLWGLNTPPSSDIDPSDAASDSPDCDSSPSGGSVAAESIGTPPTVSDILTDDDEDDEEEEEDDYNDVFGTDSQASECSSGSEAAREESFEDFLQLDGWEESSAPFFSFEEAEDIDLFMD